MQLPVNSDHGSSAAYAIQLLCRVVDLHIMAAALVIAMINVVINGMDAMTFKGYDVTVTSAIMVLYSM